VPVAVGGLLLLRGGVVGSVADVAALTVACWGMGSLTACLTVICALLAMA
jgi:hypothetical protein